MKVRHALVLAAALAAASVPAGAEQPAGTLAECSKRHSDPAQWATCIRLAQRQASDDMLDAFATTQQWVRAIGGVDGELAAALTESQRDFERYVQGQCTFVHALFARAGVADLAALACETDLLLQRTAVLRSAADSGTRK
ncbi:MAG: lysozyme inhibitor LprI family protein [Pseudomonadota bacterium]